MSFALHHRKHIEDELAQIVRRQLRKTADALTTSEGSQFRSAVHESRKSIKKVRAVAAFLTEAGATAPRLSTRSIAFVAATPGSYPSTPTECSAVAWRQPAIEAKRAHSATGSSPKQPGAWRRRVSRQESGHPLQSHGLT